MVAEQYDVCDLWRRTDVTTLITCTPAQTDHVTGSQITRETDIQMVRQKGRQTDSHTGRRTYKQKRRPADRRIHKPYLNLEWTI